MEPNKDWPLVLKQVVMLPSPNGRVLQGFQMHSLMAQSLLAYTVEYGPGVILPSKRLPHSKLFAFQPGVPKATLTGTADGVKHPTVCLVCKPYGNVLRFDHERITPPSTPFWLQEGLPSALGPVHTPSGTILVDGLEIVGYLNAYVTDAKRNEQQAVAFSGLQAYRRDWEGKLILTTKRWGDPDGESYRHIDD